MTYTVIDDFLSKQDFRNLYDCIMNKPFPWYYVGFFVSREELYEEDSWFHFSHSLYEDYTPTSPVGRKDVLTPLIVATEPVSIRNMSTHLYTKTPDHVLSKYHVDIGDIKDDPIKLGHWTTSIFYVNTNNGYTQFEEDGVKIKSVANRFITFPASTRHLGASCTDENTRIIINYNFYK